MNVTSTSRIDQRPLPASGLFGCAVRRRSGFTLLELLLVLALLIVLAALAAPAMYQALRHQNLKESADLVRGEFGRARAEAMRTGKEYVFRYVPGGSQYTYGPYELDVSAATPIQQTTTVNRFRYGDGTLAAGVIFKVADVEADSRQLELQETLKQSGGGSTDQLQILFYPDGTTQDATLYLESETGSIDGIRLRGLTGVSSPIDPEQVNP